MPTFASRLRAPVFARRAAWPAFAMAALAMVAGFAAAALADPGNPDSCTADAWIRVATTGPQARTGSAAVTHDGRSTVILFGGLVGATPMNDAWEWNGSTWTLLPSLGAPPPRRDHALAYDRARDRVVLFGGDDGTNRLGDTWEWDGSTWSLIAVGGPTPRSGHSMAWDENLQQVILYGGSDGAPQSDTWVWDGASWSLLTFLGPPPRMFAAMASDPVRKRIVLFGGQYSTSSLDVLDETWEWDGSFWMQMAPAVSPSARSLHAMTYGGDCGRVVLYGGQGQPPLDTTWRWDGIQWLEQPIGTGQRFSLAMAYDFPSSRVLIFGGFADGLVDGTTWELCCACDDEAAPLDLSGNVVFPAARDPDPPVYEDVDVLQGDVVDLYPGHHTSADTWYPGFPCEAALGGTVPDEADDPAIDDSLASHGILAPAQVIADSLASWEQQILGLVTGEPDRLASAPPVGPATPYVPPAEPYCPPQSCNYVFGGRDLVFVHGLKLKHVFQKMVGSPPGAVTSWQPPTTFPGSAENPEFYATGGYYRDIAVENWDAHIQKFFRDRGICNRYVIVSYPCGERLEVGVQAILTQISDAMRFGTNVVDLTGRQYGGKFGTPSFIAVSHSTGGLAMDAALWAAQNRPNLQAEFIARRCKAHVALTAAFGGSRFASAAVVLSGALSTVTSANTPWLCPLVRLGMVALDDAGLVPLSPPACPFAWTTTAGSVLIDLSPLVTQYKWGGPLGSITGIPTVTLSGAHPTQLFPLKTVLLPGYDDGVLNLASQSANPNSPLLWPSGFFVKHGPIGLVRTYDMGIATPRAIHYYIDQVVETRLNPVTAFLPFYVSGGANPYVSPTGMLQSVGLEFGLASGFNPLRRHTRHLSFISSAADHFNWRKLEHGADYRPSYAVHANAEETRTLLQSDEPDWYATYTPGPVHYPADDQPLLTAACLPRVEERVRGRSVKFRIFGKTKRWWIWKRRYHTLQGSAVRHGLDYLYGNVLACAAPMRDCDPALDAGNGTIRELVAAARPNPALGDLTIDFELPARGAVELVIHDAGGRRVRTLIARSLEPGRHSARLDGADKRGRPAPAGLYFWTLRSAGASTTRKALLLR